MTFTAAFTIRVNDLSFSESTELQKHYRYPLSSLRQKGRSDLLLLPLPEPSGLCVVLPRGRHNL